MEIWMKQSGPTYLLTEDIAHYIGCRSDRRFCLYSLSLTKYASVGLSGKGAHMVVKEDFFGLAESSIGVDWGWDVAKPNLGYTVTVSKYC